ncbi:uncharacterized protein LOC123696712 [Colias croceus]|uniref:uncharacterized protein LOC123696712 n=1 Tax=Colias crocea TaxID=72248 RepID=UPI001E27A455|nr:uncharacterized protein LOC123696712 [Colias croceus]
MMEIKYLVLLLACSTCTYGASFITKCKGGDSKCMKDSAQAAIPMFAGGLPEYGVKSLDPLLIKKTDASSPNLKLVITDYTVTGLRNCVMKKVKYDKPKSKMFLKLLCTGQLEGTYEMNGQLLILSIQGNGPIHVALRKAEISVELDMAEIEKNGAMHWDIKNWKHSYELKDRSDVVFDNLLSGSDVLAQAANDVIKESGNEIILEVGSPVIRDVVKAVVENINEFFHHVPLSELTLD